MEAKTKKNIFITVFITSIIIIGACAGILMARCISRSSFNNAVDSCREAVIDGFAGRNIIEVNGHTVNIRIWSDGMAAASKAAAEGDKTLLEGWNITRDKMYLTACSLYDKFLFVDDAVVYFRFVNESNTDRDLLVFRNKELIYDVVAAYQNGG